MVFLVNGSIRVYFINTIDVPASARVRRVAVVPDEPAAAVRQHTRYELVIVPPFGCNTCPVMKAPSLEARNT